MEDNRDVLLTGGSPIKAERWLKGRKGRVEGSVSKGHFSSF